MRGQCVTACRGKEGGDHGRVLTLNQNRSSTHHLLTHPGAGWFPLIQVEQAVQVTLKGLDVVQCILYYRKENNYGYGIVYSKICSELG